jgi:UDP-N-acetylmuramoyl-tripeptide--D-alanyl-D-alanine ligase
MNLTIREIAQILRADVSGSEEQILSSVSIDTRTLKLGDIFWALKGINFDGHDFVVEAFRKGAIGAVVNQDWNEPAALSTSNTILIKVDDTNKSLKHLASWWRNRFEIPVIAITGSIGKTTTKDWLTEILATKYNVFKTPGNRNNLVGLPLALLDLESCHQIAVVEMGANHQGEIVELCRIAVPTHGLITCIAPVHLEGFGNLDGVKKTKGELCDYLRPKGTVFLPIHDPILRKLAKGNKIVGFGSSVQPSNLSMEQYIRINVVGHSALGQPILEIEGQKVTLKTIGDIWIPAATAAAAIAKYFEVPVEDIITCLADLDAGPGRLKSFSSMGMEIWDDTYNSNPESLKAAINLLVSRPANRHIAVIGDMLELGETEEQWHNDVGDYIKPKNLDAVFTYGPRAAWIAQGIDTNSKITVESFQDQKPLTERLKKFLKPGDAVLFKASRAMFLERVLCQLFPEIADYYKHLPH